MTSWFSSNKTSESQGPVSNTADSLNPTTGTGSHLPPTETSHNPLSSHNDHRSNDRAHNDSSLLGNNSSSTHRHGENGGLSGVAHAADPTSGTGAHLGKAENSHNPLSSHNDYKDNERSHGSTGLTGASTHENKGAIGRATDAINPTTGRGPHVGHAEYSANPIAPSDDQKKSDHHSHAHGHEGTGAASSTAHTAEHKADRAGDALNPTTGNGTHLGGPDYSANPLSSNDDSKKTAHHDGHRTNDAVNTAEGKLEGKKNDAVHASHPADHKPTITDKIKGQVEIIHGKLTHDSVKVADGVAKKTGTAPHTVV